MSRAMPKSAIFAIRWPCLVVSRQFRAAMSLQARVSILLLLTAIDRASRYMLAVLTAMLYGK